MKKIAAFIGLIVLFFLSSTKICFGDNRTITFINNCTYNVWINMQGGAIGAQKHGSTKLNDIYCNSSSDCPNGSYTYCDYGQPHSPSNGTCFWNRPIPGSGVGTADDYLLTPGQNKSVTIPIPSSLNNSISGQMWSGYVSGRANCTVSASDNTSMFCASGHCAVNGQGLSAPASCSKGISNVNFTITSPDTPFTKPEITMLYNAEDTYDVSLVAGYNVPMSFGPTSGQNFGDSPANTSQALYWCATPGNPNSTNALPSCSWNFTPPTTDHYYYRFVSGNETDTWLTNCTYDSDCAGLSSGNYCGLILQSANPSTHRLVCGRFLGYFSPNSICTLWTQDSNESYHHPFGCNYNSNVIADMYMCTGNSSTGNYASSCYNTAFSDCCGCNNWNSGIYNYNVTATASCANTSTNWINTALPVISFFKAGCPTAYSYPFDDPSSTFQCNTNGTSNTTPNAINYTVIYCPNGSPGPAPGPTPTPTPNSNTGGADSGGNNNWWGAVIAGFGIITVGILAYFSYFDESNNAHEHDITDP
jgi:hypothetical protein